jgi:hypothetical protein
VDNSKISIDEINCRDELGIIQDREEYIANHSIDLALEHRTNACVHYSGYIPILIELALKIKSILNRIIEEILHIEYMHRCK